MAKSNGALVKEGRDRNHHKVSTPHESGFTVTAVSLPDRLHRSVARWASREKKTANELMRELIFRSVQSHDRSVQSPDVATANSDEQSA